MEQYTWLIHMLTVHTTPVKNNNKHSQKESESFLFCGKIKSDWNTIKTILERLQKI